MRLEPLYRATFRYPDGGHGTTLEGEAGSEGHYFFVAEGAVEGRVRGVLHGANHPRSRVDRTALPSIQGAIETDDGATIIFDWRGFARSYPTERRQILVSARETSLTDSLARVGGSSTLSRRWACRRDTSARLFAGKRRSLLRISGISICWRCIPARRSEIWRRIFRRSKSLRKPWIDAACSRRSDVRRRDT